MYFRGMRLTEMVKQNERFMQMMNTFLFHIKVSSVSNNQANILLLSISVESNASSAGQYGNIISRRDGDLYTFGDTRRIMWHIFMPA